MSPLCHSASLIHNTRLTAFESPHPAPQEQHLHTDWLSPSASLHDSSNLIIFHKEKSCRSTTCCPFEQMLNGSNNFSQDVHSGLVPLTPLFTFESVFLCTYFFPFLRTVHRMLFSLRILVRVSNNNKIYSQDLFYS